MCDIDHPGLRTCSRCLRRRSIDLFQSKDGTGITQNCLQCRQKPHKKIAKKTRTERTTENIPYAKPVPVPIQPKPILPVYCPTPMPTKERLPRTEQVTVQRHLQLHPILPKPSPPVYCSIVPKKSPCTEQARIQRCQPRPILPKPTTPVHCPMTPIASKKELPRAEQVPIRRCQPRPILPKPLRSVSRNNDRGTSKSPEIGCVWHENPLTQRNHHEQRSDEDNSTIPAARQQPAPATEHTAIKLEPE